MKVIRHNNMLQPKLWPYKCLLTLEISNSFVSPYNTAVLSYLNRTKAILKQVQVIYLYLELISEINSYLQCTQKINYVTRAPFSIPSVIIIMTLFVKG
jgi:hypothetical protein